MEIFSFFAFWITFGKFIKFQYVLNVIWSVFTALNGSNLTKEYARQHLMEQLLCAQLLRTFASVRKSNLVMSVSLCPGKPVRFDTFKPLLKINGSVSPNTHTLHSKLKKKTKWRGPLDLQPSSLIRNNRTSSPAACSARQLPVKQTAFMFHNTQIYCCM